MSAGTAWDDCAPSKITVRLPHHSSQVRRARRELRAELLRKGVGLSAADDAVTVLSELVSNAVRYAQPGDDGVLLTQWHVRPQTVMISVTDGGSQMDVQVQHVGMGAESGRGLHIVQNLSSRWGVHDHASGQRTVWAEVPAARA